VRDNPIAGARGKSKLRRLNKDRKKSLDSGDEELRLADGYSSADDQVFHEDDYNPMAAGLTSTQQNTTYDPTRRTQDAP
jgi:hypothetical protein